MGQRDTLLEDSGGTSATGQLRNKRLHWQLCAMRADFVPIRLPSHLVSSPVSAWESFRGRGSLGKQEALLAHRHRSKEISSGALLIYYIFVSWNSLLGAFDYSRTLLGAQCLGD